MFYGHTSRGKMATYQNGASGPELAFQLLHCYARASLQLTLPSLPKRVEGKGV